MDRARSNRSLLLSAWLLAAAAAVVLIIRLYDLFPTRFAVFPSYYTAAKLVADGEDFAKFYDDAWFFQRATELGHGELYAANTPLMAFLFLPLAGLSYDSARLLTIIAGFAALV